MLFSLIRSGYSPKEIAFVIILYFLALSLAFSGHEFAHAFSAHLMGDDTAKNRGRLTLNPMAHVDLRGMLFLILVGFGWGKPVPVNSGNYTKLKSRTISSLIVDLSGVFTNFLMALLSSIALVFVARFADKDVIWWSLVAQFLALSMSINITLLAFNLIPIPPLDGFNALFTVLPVKVKYTNFYRKYCQIAPLVLFALILIGTFLGYSILSYIMSIIAYPFATVINWITGLIASAIL